jgi:hypothetical protein
LRDQEQDEQENIRQLKLRRQGLRTWVKIESKGGSTTKAEDEPEAKGRIRQDEIRGQEIGKMIPKETRRG